jgi:hypothetical protein
MVVFPWLVLVLVLVLVGAALLEASGALRALAREHRLHFVHLSVRALAVVALVELVIVLVWGIFLRPR